MHKRRAPLPLYSPNTIFVTDVAHKTNIIQTHFSNLELPNEILLHQKVQNTADMYVATPYGTRCLARIIKNPDPLLSNMTVCIFVEVGSCIQLQNMFYFPLNDGVAPWLSKYVFKGVLFGINKTTCFAVTDIYNSQPNPRHTKNGVFASYLNDLRHLYQNTAFCRGVHDPLINSHSLHFGAPVMDRDFRGLIMKSQDLPYNIQYIYLRRFNAPVSAAVRFVKYFKPREPVIETLPTPQNNTPKSNVGENKLSSQSIQQTQQTQQTQQIRKNNNPSRLSHAVFQVKPQRQQDTYHLFALTSDEHTLQFIDVAYIPNYQTSILMNSLFRTIKENVNLDSLEESDDEDEFENPNMDKYVDLSVIKNMICEYSPKFKKWIPIRESDQPLISIKQLGISEM